MRYMQAKQEWKQVTKEKQSNIYITLSHSTSSYPNFLWEVHLLTDL